MTALFNSKKLDSEDFYKSPDGFIVFTERNIISKGGIVVKADVNIVPLDTIKKRL